MKSLKINYKDFGLKARDLDYILKTLENYKQVEAALIFGSRAKGTYKEGSDIDLALKGKRLDYDIIKEIAVQLNEYLPIPFFVDVIDYTHLKKEALKKHIDLFGKLIYVNKEENTENKIQEKR